MAVLAVFNNRGDDLNHARLCLKHHAIRKFKTSALVVIDFEPINID